MPPRPKSLQQMPNNFELIVQQEREAFQKMGERVDAVVKQIEPHLEHLGPAFKEAVDILHSPSKHSAVKIWKALAVVLNHWGAQFTVGVGKNGMQAQLNLVTAADALLGWLVKKGYLAG